MNKILQNADAAAITMQEGLAYICLITSNMTIVRAKIDVHIPKKRKGNVQQYEKVRIFRKYFTFNLNILFTLTPLFLNFRVWQNFTKWFYKEF